MADQCSLRLGFCFGAFVLECLLLFSAPEQAFAQISNSFLLDQNFSSIAGATDVATVENILVQYEQQAISEKLFPEDSRGSICSLRMVPDMVSPTNISMEVWTKERPLTLPVSKQRICWRRILG